MNGSRAHKMGPEEADKPKGAQREGKKQTHRQYVEKRECTTVSLK